MSHARPTPSITTASSTGHHTRVHPVTEIAIKKAGIHPAIRDSNRPLSV